MIKDAVFVYRLLDEDELKWHTRVHAHAEGEYELHYFLQGSGGFLAESRVVRLGPGTAFVTRPREVHSVRSESNADPVTYYAVLFALDPRDADLAELLGRRIESGKPYQVGDGYRFFFEQVREHALSGDLDLAASAAYLLASFLFLLPAGRAGEHASGGRGVHIERALKIMQKAVFEDLSLDDVAGKLSLDKSYFVRLFRSAMRETPMRYYRRLKMEAASALLASSALQVKAVSERLRFENEFHFSRAFKAHTGLSPLEYRKKYAQIV